MKLPKSEKDFEELMKGIKWNRIIPPLVSVLQPVIIFGAWLAFSKMDNRAAMLSRIIAVAEPIPAIDLNVPKPVVLASMYQFTDEVLDILDNVINFLQDIEIPSWDNIKKDIVEDIDPIIPGIDEAKFLQDYAACKKNAKDTLGILYNKYTGSVWITSCLVQKGYVRKVIEERVRQELGI